MDNLTREQFDKVLRTVERKHKNKYKFILNGGISLKNAIFSLFCSVWKNETIPEVWYNSLLVQIYKGKGSPNNLDNIRHIHLKEEVPKLFSQIVTMAAKDNLVENMSKFQIATKPSHRAKEHVFVILSLIASYEQKGKALILSMFDLSKYFDSESLVDCCSEVYKNKTKGKVYRLLFHLNKNIKKK